MTLPMKRLRQVPKLFTSPLYRRAICCRTLCRLLAKTNPDLRYVGLARGDDLTFLLLHDSVITPYSIAGSGFERDELLRVIEWCGKLGRPPNGVFVDVGANMGTTTLMALRSGSFSRAVCIEPGPENLRLIRLNVEANQLADRVSVVAAAAASTQATSQLYLASDNSGDHQLAPATGIPLECRDSVEVSVKPLDSILAAAGVKADDVSCIWVDTQGSEGFVLEGSTDLVAAGVPFSIEFWPEGCRRLGSYESLLHILEHNFAGFVDLREPGAGTVRHSSTIRRFALPFETSLTHTDLFLIPRVERKPLP